MILAPKSIKSVRAPFSPNIRKTCFEPGATAKLTFRGNFFPLTILATVIKSLKEEFVQLPTHT